MAVSVTDLAIELRIIAEATATIPEGQSAVVTRLHGYATAEVERMAPGAPDTHKDLAAVRLAAYIYDLPSSQAGAGFSNAPLNSGALSMLKPWIQRRALAIGGEDDTDDSE